MDDYFRPPHPGWMPPILFGLYLLVHTRFSPTTIPGFLGPVGRISTYLGTEHPVFVNILKSTCVTLRSNSWIVERFIGTLLIHIAEAVYTVHVCRQKRLSTSATIKWTLSTFVFGYTSLIRLKPYKPRE